MIKQMRAKVLAGALTHEEAEAMIARSLEPARMKPMWPTPMAADARGSAGRGKRELPNVAKMYPIPRTTGLDGGSNSRKAAKARGMWPTPTVNGNNNRAGLSEKSGDGLATAVAREMVPTPTANRRSGLQSHGKNFTLGSLNPTWVEWLMGYPSGWTDLEGSATPSSPKSREPLAAPSSSEMKDD
jgi:hypothetical protein